jgi:hypothetical protein
MVRVRATLYLAVYHPSVRVGDKPLENTTSNFIFQLNTCGYGPYVTSSLTRGWVYRLQSLLVLASAVILRSKSHGTHNHILLSQIRDSHNLEGQVPIFISLRNSVARLYRRALGSLLVALYDSHGYGGGIQSWLHTRFWLTHTSVIRKLAYVLWHDGWKLEQWKNMWSFLGNGTVNMFPRQQMLTQQRRTQCFLGSPCWGYITWANWPELHC